MPIAFYQYIITTDNKCIPYRLAVMIMSVNSGVHSTMSRNTFIMLEMSTLKTISLGGMGYFEKWHD